MQHVQVLSTGGTIASTDTEDGGSTPSVSGADLIKAVPELEDVATLSVTDVCQVSGFQMHFESVGALADAVANVDESTDGIVVTHGTDTMAESAYYLALVSQTDVPVVFTGAQRAFDQRGTDGPSNLLAAVRAVTTPQLQAAGGSYLVFNDELHGARRVVKGHTSKLETFTSPGSGPLAEQTPNGYRFFREPVLQDPPFPGVRVDPDVRIEIVTNALGMGGAQVRRASRDGVDGFVLAGTGLGNATERLGAALEDAIDAGVPVVLTSRCHAGTTAGVYGGPGGARTLLEGGAIRGGALPPWKARLKLAVALSADSSQVDVHEIFANTDADL